MTRRGADLPNQQSFRRFSSSTHEHVETASERAAVHERARRRARFRLFMTIVGFAVAIVVAVWLGSQFFRTQEAVETYSATIYNPYAPTIEIVDEDAAMTAGKVTSRMKEYIGTAEVDFRELGYTPVRATIPSGAIREVDFYLDGIPGRIKLTIDRGSGVSVEDADRMLRYLAGQGITEFEYIDVRIDGKAYWK